MEERIVFMQTEDNMVTFEKEDGSTIVYPIFLVPGQYKEGDIIRVKLHLDYIEFLELDTDEMEHRRESLLAKKSRLRERAKRGTNKA